MSPDNGKTQKTNGSPEYRTALLIAAHPDDPEFLFGAAVARLVSEGVTVHYVICSDGANGSRDSNIPNTQLAAIRSQEQRKAADVLGVREVVFLAFPDGLLSPSAALRMAIAREIRRFKPDLILTHFPYRVLDVPIDASHPDHMAAGEAAMCAVFPDASNPRAFPELMREGLEPHRVREVWLAGYECANHYVDASPFVAKKMQAIMCHKSQLNGSSSPPAWVEHWMRWSGKQPGYEFAESFKRIEL